MVSPSRRASWFKRGLWALNAAGSVYTLAALIGLAIGVGAVVVAVVRAVSRLPAPWLALLGGGVAIIVLVTGGLALAGALGARLIANQAQLLGQARIYQGSLTLMAQLIVSSREPSTPAEPTRVVLRRLKGDRVLTRRKVAGRIYFQSDTSAHSGHLVYSVTFALPPPRRIQNPVVARVDFVDQFNRRHRNTVEFPYDPGLNVPKTPKGTNG